MKTQLALLAAIALSIPALSSATTITFGGTSLANQGLTTNYSGVTTINFESGEPGSITGGSVVSGSQANVYLEPTNDTSHYLTTGASSLSASLGSFDYFGLDWGSIDSYNSITLLGSNGVNQTYTGTQIANLDGFQPDGATSIYVNFFDTPGSSWTGVQLSSTQNAFETDNWAYGNVSPAPEPGTIGMMTAGGLLMALPLLRRRRKA